MYSADQFARLMKNRNDDKLMKAFTDWKISFEKQQEQHLRSGNETVLQTGCLTPVADLVKDYLQRLGYTVETLNTNATVTLLRVDWTSA